jgi:hypothetical protein
MSHDFTVKMYEEIKSRLNSGNARSASVQDPLPCSLSNDVKIKICKAVILPALCGSLAPNRRIQSRVFEKRERRRICQPNSKDVTVGWRELRIEQLHNLDC